MKYFNDMPLELMPKVLAFIQESSKYSGTEDKNLDRLFEVVRSRPEISASNRVVCEKKAPIALITAAAAMVMLFVGFMWSKM